MTLIWDSHFSHSGKKMAAQITARDWVEVVFLPRYAPEPNPVEALWAHLKRVLEGRLFRSLEELERVINAHLRLACRRADLLRGFIDSVGLEPHPARQPHDQRSVLAMNDSGQVAVLAHATSGKAKQALNLIARTALGDLQGNASAPTAICQAPVPKIIDQQLAHHQARSWKDATAVFHTGVALSLIDVYSPASSRSFSLSQPGIYSGFRGKYFRSFVNALEVAKVKPGSSS